jgi:hypothetical protein
MSDLVLFQPVRALDRNGEYAPGALARFYEPGTLTPRTVYADAALSTAHPTPLVADASGVFAPVYTSGNVKAVVTDADGVALPKGTMDPAFVVAAGGAEAGEITFDSTSGIPESNVQDAIERVDENWRTFIEGAGWGNEGSAIYISNMDATTTTSGVHRFDGSTTGTRPADWSAGDDGVLILIRQTSSAAIVIAARRSDGIIWARQMSASVWGAWYRLDSPSQSQAVWNAGTSTAESAISPEKLRDAIDHKRRVFQVEDRRSSGTDSGGTTATTWVIRTLNTDAIADLTGASRSGNVVTLPAGRYRVEIQATGYRCQSHRVRLYSVTASAELARGLTAYSASSADASVTTSTLDREITLGVSTEVRIEHWATLTFASSGLGLAASDGGQEVYLIARFEWLGES